MYDYDPNKVSISRLRRSYELNDYEVENVMAALWPHALFPLELWHKTHDLFWHGLANSVTLFYSIESPEFPDSNAANEKYFHAHLYAQKVKSLFSMLASRIHVDALRKGLRYIVSMTYENIEDVTFQEEMDSSFERLSMVEESNNYIFTQHLQKEEFIAIMEEKILSLSSSWYSFIAKMYQDTILVDTVAAIRHLHFLKIPFKKEVKGIPRALVESVQKGLAEEVAHMASVTSQPPKQRATGSRKDITRINATRKVCEELVEELLQERQALENDKNSWKPRLFNYINGKTNWDTFFKFAATRLGNKPHRDTAREVWKKVPAKYIHPGRMPE